MRVPERRRRADLDEKVSLYPDEAEDVLKKLLGADDVPISDDEDSEHAEDEDS